jgi:hypothetical protein
MGRSLWVSADSLDCQKRTAHIITREKGGDFILQVHDNQRNLLPKSRTSESIRVTTKPGS